MTVKGSVELYTTTYFIVQRRTSSRHPRQYHQTRTYPAYPS